MENFKDLQALWLADRPDFPKVEEMEGHIRRFNRRKRTNNLLLLVFLLLLVVFSFGILYLAAYQMWTSYLGIVLWIGIGFRLIYSKLKRKRIIAELEDLPSNEFLKALENEVENKSEGKSTTQALLYSIWALGFILYLYEFTHNSNSLMIISYAALMLFAIFIWVVYRPFMTKRYFKSIQKTIDHIQYLKKQLDEKE
jgi:hypothetical protein